MEKRTDHSRKALYHNIENNHSANLVFKSIFERPGDFFSFSTAQRPAKETKVVCHPNYLIVSGES